MAEQGRWVAIDQGGTRRASGVIDALGDDVLATGLGWTLKLVQSGGGATLRVVDSVGRTTFEQPVVVTAPVTYDVILDNVSREYRADVGDAVVLLPVELDAIAPSATDGAPSALCVDLSRQL
jgi:hypothetical protein